MPQRVLIAFTLVLTLVLAQPAILATDVAGAAPVTALASGMPLPQEQALLDLSNADRIRNGLDPLSFDPVVLDVARARAQAQLDDAPLSHYDALGQLAFVPLLAEAGAEYALAGENLARFTGYDPNLAETVEQALMSSPAHRQNILDQSFNRLAVGVAWDDAGRVAFAQIFRAEP